MPCKTPLVSIGTADSDQLVPFQLRAFPALSMAIQKVVKTHEIAVSEYPAESALVADPQPVPFQTKVFPTSSPAMQKLEVPLDD